MDLNEHVAEIRAALISPPQLPIGATMEDELRARLETTAECLNDLLVTIEHHVPSRDIDSLVNPVGAGR